MDKITFSVQMKKKHIFRFNLYHAYTGFSGLFGVAISVFSWILLIADFENLTDQSKTVLTVLGAWFLVIYPLILHARAGAQAKRNESMKEGFSYVLDPDGITVSQGEASQNIRWNAVRKIVETRTQYYVYTSSIHAFIFPKEDIGVSAEEFDRAVCGWISKEKIAMKGALRRFKQQVSR